MSLIFLLDSCESLDFFEFTLSLSDKLLTLLDEYFNDLAISTASVSHECTFLLEGTYLRVKIIKSIIISASYYLQRTDCIFDVHLPISWRVIELLHLLNHSAVLSYQSAIDLLLSLRVSCFMWNCCLDLCYCLYVTAQ